MISFVNERRSPKALSNFWGFQLSGLSPFDKKRKKKNSMMFWAVNDGKCRVHQVFFINVTEIACLCSAPPPLRWEPCSDQTNCKFPVVHLMIVFFQRSTQTEPARDTIGCEFLSKDKPIQFFWNPTRTYQSSRNGRGPTAQGGGK